MSCFIGLPAGNPSQEEVQQYSFVSLFHHLWHTQTSRTSRIRIRAPFSHMTPRYTFTHHTLLVKLTSNIFSTGKIQSSSIKTISALASAVDIGSRRSKSIGQLHMRCFISSSMAPYASDQAPLARCLPRYYRHRPPPVPRASPAPNFLHPRRAIRPNMRARDATQVSCKTDLHSIESFLQHHLPHGRQHHHHQRARQDEQHLGRWHAPSRRPRTQIHVCHVLLVAMASHLSG